MTQQRIDGQSVDDLCSLEMLLILFFHIKVKEEELLLRMPHRLLTLTRRNNQ